MVVICTMGVTVGIETLGESQGILEVEMDKIRSLIGEDRCLEYVIPRLMVELFIAKGDQKGEPLWVRQ